MIRNKLSDLLGQRQMKISRLSLLTGIARSTLTPIYFNQTEMIKIETINKICMALNISVNDFFESVNFDIDFIYDEDANEEINNYIASDEAVITGYNIDIGVLCEIKELNVKHIFEMKFVASKETIIDDNVFFSDSNFGGDGKWHDQDSKIIYELDFGSDFGGEENKQLFFDYLNRMSVGMQLTFENKMNEFIRTILIKKFKDDNSNSNNFVPKQQFEKLFKKAEIIISDLYI